MEFLKLPPHHFPERENDCAVWALAAFLSKPYEDVLIEAAKEDPKAGKMGLHVTQIMRIAERLGTPLRFDLHKHFQKTKAHPEGKWYGREINLEDDSGIISVWLKINGKKYGHVAVLFEGKVIDSVGGTMVWDAETYCHPDRAIVHGLLRVK